MSVEVFVILCFLSVFSVTAIYYLIPKKLLDIAVKSFMKGDIDEQEWIKTNKAYEHRRIVKNDRNNSVW